MSHRSKHRRANWPTERLEATLVRAREEGKRPAPQPKERHRRRRALPVSVFLRTRVYR